MADMAAPSNGSTTISLTPEQFERMYLSSPAQSPAKAGAHAQLKYMFGNPTPLAVLGLVMSLTPLSCDLMGWRGAGVDGAASTGAYFFMGGLLMILSGLLEFFLGNTFQFVVFCGYGSFWLTYGATLTPYFGAYAHYSADAANPGAGLSTMGFNASFAFYLTFMAIFSFLACICALRTNLCFTLLELFVFLFFALLASAFFGLADGSSNAGNVQIASGACGFVASILGWYFFFALSLVSVNFPIKLPIFDLSGGISLKKKQNEVVHDKEMV